MKNIPVTCVDDFYSDPDSIREFALKQEFYPSEGQWPGKRTNDIKVIDPMFYEMFCKKIFSVFTDTKDITKYFVKTSFQLINKFDEDPNSLKNKGWIHIDNDCIFAGIIYLNPDPDPETGTSIFKVVNESTIDNDSYCKQDFYSGKHIPENYEQVLHNHNSSYIETVRFNNVYNRMICFDSTQPHGVNSFYSSKGPRLTQVFFVFELESTTIPPISRHKQFL